MASAEAGQAEAGQAEAGQVEAGQAEADDNIQPVSMTKGQQAPLLAASQSQAFLEASQGGQLVPSQDEGSQPVDPQGDYWWSSDELHVEVPPDYNIHGQYSLEPNKDYVLVFVPSDAPLEFESLEHAHQLKQQNGFAESYNAPKLLISLIQAIWAIITLYRARGDQIDQYGYAAFGLTVAPYAWMSVLNIIGSLLTPDYPAIFMVRTPVMDRVEELGLGKFTGELRVKIDYSRHYEPLLELVHAYVTASSIFCGMVPLAIVGGLSGFRNQNSTQIQRGFTMSWLVMSILIGPPMGFFLSLPPVNPEDAWLRERANVLIISATIVYGATAIGGMVVVGQMIHDFGICTLLG